MTKENRKRSKLPAVKSKTSPLISEATYEEK
jgi:hypothetical protein